MPDSDLGGQPANQASLLQALASLNEIGAAINRMPPEHANLAGALQRIVESAIRVVPASSAVIYAYDSRRRQFDTQQYVWAGESVPPAPGHEPRPDGLGQRAVTQRRVVLSYDESDLAIHPLKRSAGVRSAACFPMIVAEDVVGALYVYLPEARPFSDLERLMLENFVNQAALAVSHTRHLEAVQAELGRREEELGHLRRTGQLISSRLQINATLDAILQMALEITNARYGIFRLVDKTGRYLITRAIAGDGLAQPLVENLPVDANSVMAQAARTRQPLLIADLRQPPWSSIYYPLDARMEMRSELAVPLINVDGRLEGVLNLESTRVGAFSEQDSHLLQAMATQAVIAIQETRLLDALLEVAELLLTQPLQAVLERLTAFACDLLNASAGAIWKLDDGDPPALALQASTPAQTPGRRVAPAGSLAGRALLEQRTLYADRAGLDDPGALPEDWSPGWQNMLVVPLLSSGDQQALGAFSVYNLESGASRPAASDWDEKILTCLARYAALALQNAGHQDALRLAQERSAVAETFAAVGDVAANALHHLNNKVGTIPVRIQGIQAKSRVALASDSYLATGLQEIEQNARQALATVRDSLAHLNPIHLAPVAVSACVQAAIAQAGLPAGLQVEVSGLDDLPAVLASQSSLTWVFVNLLHNAAEALQTGGPDAPQVHISGRARRGRVEIAVSDNGPGIPPELHEQIFELSFSRRGGAPPARPQPSRLGFGLWWVKTSMARLGGSVRVESDGRHGATFYLQLPEARSAQ